MGTFIDYSYRFEGDAAGIKKARALIEDFQAEHAHVSGSFSNHNFDMPPKLGEDGALAWHCYTTSEMSELELAMAKLTKKADLRVYSYWGCTDGCSESGMDFLERGAIDECGSWDADIGIDAARAILRLSAAASAEDLLVLVEAFECAVSDGWDEDDYPWLWKAQVVADAIMAALASHPIMADDKRVSRALLDMKDKLWTVRESLVDIAGFDGSELDGVDQLLSVIEAMELAHELPAGKPAKKSAHAL